MSTHKLIRAAFSFALLVSEHVGFAGLDTWTSGGPEGRFVPCIVIDPTSSSTLYAGTDNGVYKSTDGGASWFRAGLENTNVYRMAIDPLRPATLYAKGMERSGSTLVYKTTDGAGTWKDVASLGGVPLRTEGGVAIDPVNTDTVYVAGPWMNSGVFKTTNGGASWSAMNSGMPMWSMCFGTDYCKWYYEQVDALAVDPVSPAKVYAIADGRIYRSLDGGSSWSEFSTAPIFGAAAAGDRWASLLFDSSSALYAAGGAGVYRITPSLTPIYEAAASAFAVDPSAPGTLYLASTVTTDAVTQPAQFATVFFKSTNGGSLWSPLGNGLSDQYVSSLVVDPTGHFLHAGTGTNDYGTIKAGHGVFEFEITMPVESPVIPIVVDVATDTAHYTTELTLTNDTAVAQTVNLVYTASLGSAEGSGMVTDVLVPGEQRRIEDVIGYLREKGLGIPSSTETSGQGGTLRIVTPDFDGVGRVAALARTATSTESPLPAGRAGLAYGSVQAFPGYSALRIFGLRSSDADRSNLAVVNTSASPMTVRITVFSGSGDGKSSVVRDGLMLPAYGWVQINSPELLDQPGIANGWALVERISELGGLYAYGVVNDRVTNDGSFLEPSRGGTYGGPSLMGGPGVVPVLAETPSFSSELVLANRSDVDAKITLSYRESLSPEQGWGGTASLTLPARTQWIVPAAIGFLRQHGVWLGQAGGLHAGSLEVEVGGQLPSDAIYAGARTATPSGGGGEFGLFTPCIAEMAGSTLWGEKAYIYGLVADDWNRSNVAVANARFGCGSVRCDVSLTLEVHDGDAGGAVKGDPTAITLAPGQWKQFDGILKAAGVTNGWVEITQTNLSEYYNTSWLAYGVINDGGRSRERTGDGAYVPMVK